MPNDTLSIDDLLSAVSKQPSPKEDTTYIYLPCTISCNCGKVYHATAKRQRKYEATYRELKYRTHICPSCINLANWLEHFYNAKEEK